MSFVVLEARLEEGLDALLDDQLEDDLDILLEVQLDMLDVRLLE